MFLAIKEKSDVGWARKLIQLIKSLGLVHWVLLLAVGFLGVAGTFSIGHFIEKDAMKTWVHQAELDVSAATIAAQSWLAQSETIVNGLALGFHQPDQITVEAFDELISKAEEWNSEFSLDTVAVVRRVMRSERQNIEQLLGKPLSSVEDPSKSIPDAFQYLVVTHSSDHEELLRPGVDLLSLKNMGTVVTAAQQIPDHAVMGPAYLARNGRLYTLVAIGLPDGGKNTIIVGQVDLSEMIESLLSDQLPKGIELRLSERDNEDRAETLVRPIYGLSTVADNVVKTIQIRVTRGQARWNYNWDITTDYLGGAPTANVTMFQIGGLIITILVVYSIGLLSVQNVIIKRTVDERTRELTDEAEERLRSANAVQESDARLRAVFEHTPICLNLKDREGRYVLLNKPYEEWLGFTSEEIIGKKASEFLENDGEVENLTKAESLVLETGETVEREVNVLGRDGKIHDRILIKFPVKLQDGSIAAVGTVAVDITPLKRVENELREARDDLEKRVDERTKELKDSEARYRFTFENAPIGMALITPEGTRFKVNQALADFLGDSVENLTGTDMKSTSGSDDDLSESMRMRQQVLNGEITTYRNIRRYLHKQGQVVWGEVSGALFRNEDGEPEHFIAHTIDITEQKLAQDNLREANDDLEQKIHVRTKELEKARENAEHASELFSKAFHASPVLFAIASADEGRHYEVNDAWVNITGYSRDEAIHKTALQL